jgi:hypothetical protein
MLLLTKVIKSTGVTAEEKYFQVACMEDMRI